MGKFISSLSSDLDGYWGKIAYCNFKLCFYLSACINLTSYWYYDCFIATETIKHQIKFSISPVSFLNSWSCCLISSRDKQEWNSNSCTAVTLLYVFHMLPPGAVNRNKNWNTTPTDLALFSVSMLLAPTLWLFVTVSIALGNDRHRYCESSSPSPFRVSFPG